MSPLTNNWGWEWKSFLCRNHSVYHNTEAQT